LAKEARELLEALRKYRNQPDDGAAQSNEN